jgi:CRP/FNR family transcriptional regulator
MKIQEIIANNFYNTFENKLLKEMGDYGIVKYAEPDQIILEIRTNAEFIPIITSGIAKVMRRDGKGKGLFLHYLTKNQTSAIALTYSLENKKSEIRLKALSKVTYIMVPAKVVNSWFLNYDSWRRYYLNLNQKQTSNIIEKINDIAFENLEYRLLKYLEETSLVFNDNTIFIKHFDISRDLRVSREAISRTLKKMEKEEVISLGRNKITLN